jgi:hypothetical protein
MDLGCGSRGGASALQVQSPESKTPTQVPSKKKEKNKEISYGHDKICLKIYITETNTNVPEGTGIWKGQKHIWDKFLMNVDLNASKVVLENRNR